MYTTQEDTLGLRLIAKAWSKEKHALPEDHIMGRILKAYWTEDFSKLRAPDRHGHWPHPHDTLRVLEFVDGFPLGIDEEDEVTSIADGASGQEDLLSLLAVSLFEDYPEQGRAVLEAIRFPRDMIEAWCLDQGIPLPEFWFPKNIEEHRRLPGRPSVMHRIEAQMRLRAKNGQLEDTMAAESRVLEEWAQNTLSADVYKPKAKTIANQLRNIYRGLTKKD